MSGFSFNNNRIDCSKGKSQALTTIKDLCVEKGVSRYLLTKMIDSSEFNIKPVLERRGAKYYPRKELLAWYESVKP